MSSQRYAPPSEGRIPPRDRSPPRPPYNSNTQAGRNSTSGSVAADSNGPSSAPRGPKAFADHRLSAAPSPSRGRGYAPRGDYRPDFRDREPYKGVRDVSPTGDSWRDYDRRENAPDHGDFRAPRDPAPRDFDFGRGRRGMRDAPPGRFNDARGPPAFPPRDEFSRGRGRGDWTPRGRGRGGYYEDRPGFRGRSRSPRPYRPSWDREPSRDDRPEDRFDPPRFDRRDSDALDREERAREALRYRRELAINITPHRGPNASPGPASPTVTSAGPPHSASSNRPPSSSGKDLFSQRRTSSSFGLTGRPPLRSEPTSAREPPSNDGLSRPSSPLPAPEVPAFGSVSNKSGSNNESPWNVWKAPADQKPTAPPQAVPTGSAPAPPPALAPISSRAPQSTKPDAEIVAPKAPRAQRLDSFKGPGEGNDNLQNRSGTIRKSLSPTLTSSQAPVARPADQNETVIRAPPSGPRQVPGAPSAPKAHAKFDGPSPASWSPPSGPAQASLTSPKIAAPASAPSAPRALTANNQPSFGNVPTGPRSARQQPPGNDLRIPTGPASDRGRQWARQDSSQAQQRLFGASVPAKREHDGTEREPWSPKAPIASDQGAMDWQKSEEKQSHMNGHAQQSSAGEEGEDTAKTQENGNNTMAYDDDDEDEVEMNEIDSAQNEEKFERNKARLEAQKIDLSADHLTGRPILRQLSLLSCLLVSDPSVFFESRRDKTRQTVEATADLETPRLEETVTEDVPREPSPKLTPSPVGTPELKALPYLAPAPLTPISDLDAFQENLRRQDATKPLVRNDIRRRADAALDEEDNLRVEYERSYRSWRVYTRVLDRQKEEFERQQAGPIEEAPEPLPVDESPNVAPAAAEPRRRAFNTEFDLQKVLEMSRAEAELEAQARKEKEMVSSRPDYDREAVVPELAPELDLRSPEDQDLSRLEVPTYAVNFWEFEPPTDDFNADEHNFVVQNFSTYPKKFGKIAQGLPGRTYKDCINHYYSTKWNGQYKAVTKDKKKGKVSTKRAARGTNARPRANQLISNLDDAKPELYDGEETNAPLMAMALTESGRPRRAAAPSFRDKGSADQSIDTTKRGKVEGASAEKPKRGAKAGASSRRRAKGQNAARQPSMSPEKQMQEGMQHDMRLNSSNGEIEGLQTPSLATAQMNYSKSEPHAFNADYQGTSPMGISPNETKSQAARGGSGPSSYWSVHEVTSFPGLIKHYGTDWGSIANAMGTKSHTMVKNYYGRLLAKDPEIGQWAKEPDARRERGEDLGVPPATGSTPRRARNDTQLNSVTRALAPSKELVEVDDDTPPTTAHGLHSQQTPHSAYRSATSAPLVDRTHARAPSYGQPPSLVNISPPVASARPTFTGAPHRTPESQNVYPVDRRELGIGRAIEQQRPAPSAVDSLRYHGGPTELWERSSRGGEVFQPPAYVPPSSGMPRPSSPPRYGERPLFGPTSSTRMQPLERHIHEDIVLPRRADSPGPASLRYGADPAGARPASTSYFDPARSSGPTLGRESQMQPPRAHESEQARPAPPPPAPRKSNLMSLLNAEEPAAPSNPAPAATHSRVNTPPQYGSISQSRYPASAYPPARPLSQSSRHENLSDMGRQPQPTPSSYRSAAEVTDPARRPAPAPYRPEWPTRRMESPPAYDSRSAIRAPYEQRYNPSPPPPREAPHESSRAYDARVHQSHYGQPYRAASPPSVRTYNYASAPAPSHSRDSSTSRLQAQAPLPTHRESQYPEHRYSSSQNRLSDRGPPPAMQHPSSVFAPHGQPATSAPYQSSRTPGPPQGMQHSPDDRDYGRVTSQSTDWTAGIQQQYRESVERPKEIPQVDRYDRDWDRGRERRPPPPHQPQGDAHDRYGPVRYGPVGGQSGYPPQQPPPPPGPGSEQR